MWIRLSFKFYKFYSSKGALPLVWNQTCARLTQFIYAWNIQQYVNYINFYSNKRNTTHIYVHLKVFAKIRQNTLNPTYLNILIIWISLCNNFVGLLRLHCILILIGKFESHTSHFLVYLYSLLIILNVL